MYSRELFRDILEWDIQSWKQAVLFWDRFTADIAGARVLDIGARNGGLSLYFALKGAHVICSDLKGPNPQAAELHRKYNLSNRITYADIDAAAIELPDNGLDIVCFKSVLGAVGHHGNYAHQEQAIREFHRVLKPGGMLLFAENLTASWLHAFLRRAFIEWGRSWRYVSPAEIDQLLAVFREIRLGYTGFFAAFGRAEWQRTLLHSLDVLIDPLIPRRSHYLVYGCARK